MSDRKDEAMDAENVVPASPPNYKYTSIAELYREYDRSLVGRSFVDPCGQANRFLPENFPHLVKLEYYNRKLNQWVNAKASRAIEQLRAGVLDESSYRIGDESRPRTLFWVPDILEHPKEIHDNIRNNGIEVYSKLYKRSNGKLVLKIVLVHRKAPVRIVITSFFCSRKYHTKNVKLPARHP